MSENITLRESVLIKLKESLTHVRVLIVQGDQRKLTIALRQLEFCQRNLEELIKKDDDV